jgi:prephenate dehydrogenase
MNTSVETVGIIGYGRFGQLWADALAPLVRTVVYDEKWEGAGKPVLPPTFASGTLKDVAAAEVLFLAVPISQLETCCSRLASEVPANTIVVDVSSVKVYPAKVMEAVLPGEQPLIGTHPLFGPDSVARLGLPGRRIAFCSLRATAKQAEAVRWLLTALRLQIIETTPEDHDRQMARSQALVHLLGRTFANLKLEKQEMSTPDYESLLNINSLVNNDSWQLFFDMQRYNPYAAPMRRALRNSLEEIEELIEKANRPASSR